MVKTYPLVRVEVSSKSHPFFTGQQRTSRVEGRSEKFRRRYSRNPEKK